MNKANFDGLGFGFAKKGKKKEDKISFLTDLKKQRGNRETQRNELKSALKIQAFYRSVRGRQIFLTSLEGEILKKLNDIAALQKMLDPTKFAIVLFKAFKSYPLFLKVFAFYTQRTAKSHIDVIEPIVRFLIKLLAGLENPISFLSEGDPAKEKLAIFKLKKIFGIVMHLNFVEKLIASKEFSSTCSEWVRVFLPPKKSDDEMISEEQQKLREKKIGIFNQLASGLTSNIIEKMVNNPTSFEEVSFRTFIFEMVGRNSVLLSRPVFDRMTDLYVIPKALDSLAESSRLGLLNTYLELGQIPSKELPAHPDIAQDRLANFIRMLKDVKTSLEKLPESAVNNVFEVLMQLIKDFETCSTNKYGKVISAMDMEDEEEEKSITEKMAITMSKSKEVVHKSKIRDSYPLKFNDEQVGNFCEFLSHSINKLPENTNSSKIVSNGCSALNSFRFWLNSSQRNSIHSLLAFKYKFYKPLFKCLEESNFDKDYFIINSEKWMPILDVFCDVYTKKLMITDDEEFVGNTEIVDEKIQENNISLKKIVFFGKFLNELVFKIVWDRIEKLYPLKKASIKLLKELYNRDCRIKYTGDPSFWNIPVLSDAAYDIQSDNPLKKDLIPDICADVPHMISFENRLKIFQIFLEKDKENQDRFPYFSESDDEGNQDSKLVRIRRQYILEDGYEYLARKKAMKSLFQIKFINDYGMEEEGIDGGGLLKEFMTQLSKVAFDSNYGLFEEKEDKTLVPNPNSHLVPDHLKLFSFLGRMVGKAIYENNLIESMFSVIFLNRILRVKNTINELKYADKMLYKNLLQLKHKEGLAENLGLTFSVSENVMGIPVTHNLKENGDKIEVDETNKLEYIDLLCSFRLNSQIDPQSRAFAEGLKVCIDPSWFHMFNHEELQLLICGSKRLGFKVQDLCENTEYNDFNKYDQTIKDFWEVLNEVSDEDKSLFLLFVTGCSRPPTLGFKYLNPKLCIQKSSFDESHTDFLPSSSTCMNLLKLPDYKDKEKLRTKLLYAIRSNSGFEMG